MANFSIYKITCVPSGNIYIGQSVDVAKRKYAHFLNLRKGTHQNQMLQRSYDKYGESAFVFEIIEKGIDETEIDNREVFWIEHFDSFKNGFNLTIGGGGVRGFGTPCKWNGIAYSTMYEAARANGIKPQTMWKRINNGHESDESIQTWKASGKPCIWNGIAYKSINQAAQSNGINQSILGRYLNDGITCDADIKHRKAPCVWNGIEYGSIADAARANNVAVDTMKRRIYNGHKCDADLTPKNRECIWNGIKYHSVSECAVANNTTISTMSKWLRKEVKT